MDWEPLLDVWIDMDDPLLQSVQFARGVGPERASLLKRLRIDTIEDLLLYLPRDVIDLSDIRPAWQLEADVLQSVEGEVADLDGRRISGNRSMQAVLLDCEGHYVRALWFNQPWVLKRYVHGQRLLISGKPRKRAGRWEFTHPRVQIVDGNDDVTTGGILPRYGLTDGLRMHEIRRMTRQAVEDYAELIPDFLPEGFRAQQSLLERQVAVRQLHCPDSVDLFERACRRLIFDDLLEFQLGIAMRRRVWKTDVRSPRLKNTARIDSRIRRLFDFEFTDGQNRAVREIAQDLDSPQPMHRLLQADVGAGKTAIAIYAMLVAVAAGHQAVLMAPTEVLATQHWQTINSILVHSRVNRVALTGNLTAAQRATALEGIRTGETQLVVGTQAVIQTDVQFKSLGLAVIDEQHKFGVMQRATFSDSGQAPHVLVMTATPIPRSLCLTQFGDLDLTIVKERPPGRQPVVTSRVRGENLRRRAWDFVRRQLDTGRQVYIVCPRVSVNEDDTTGEAGSGLIGAQQLFDELSAGELRNYRVGLVHGQMSRDSKAEAMEAFRDHELDALVSTTVIEVGVDVANATLMLIYQAERFGLSQLHQLRGRVGRGRYQGYCMLFSDADTPEAEQRLAAMERTDNGFEIAEADFELRGPGDILGVRQHGQLPLRVADLVRDADMLEQARNVAFELVQSGAFDSEHFAPLKIRILERFARIMDLPQSG